MQRRPILQRLDLPRPQTHACLDAPHLADLGGPLALAALGRREHNLLLALDVVALEEPGGRVLDERAVVALDDLFEERGDAGLGHGPRASSLFLLFFTAGGEEAGGQHEAEEEFVGIVGCEEEVGFALGDLAGFGLVGGDDDGVADDGAEAIDLRAELDLDDLSGFEYGGGVGGIRG